MIRVKRFILLSIKVTFERGNKIDMHNMNYKMLVRSYSYLLVIENNIRNKTISRLEKDIGQNWKWKIRKRYFNSLTNKSIENMFFHELISLINLVPELHKDYDENTLYRLRELTNIRNKVAHCKVISNDEFHKIYYVYSTMYIQNESEETTLIPLM